MTLVAVSAFVSAGCLDHTKVVSRFVRSKSRLLPCKDNEIQAIMKIHHSSDGGKSGGKLNVRSVSLSGVAKQTG